MFTGWVSFVTGSEPVTSDFPFFGKHHFLLPSSPRVMSLPTSSAAVTSACTSILNDASGFESWLIAIKTTLTEKSLYHLVAQCPYLEGLMPDRLDLKNEPIKAPVGGTESEILHAEHREEHQQAVNKAYGLITKSLSDSYLRLFDQAKKPSCSHCVVKFFTAHFHREMEQTNPRASHDLLNSL